MSSLGTYFGTVAGTLVALGGMASVVVLAINHDIDGAAAVAVVSSLAGAGLGLGIVLPKVNNNSTPPPST